jgi:fatty acid/phospholipid biosynthesis enzyme
MRRTRATRSSRVIAGVDRPLRSTFQTFCESLYLAAKGREHAFAEVESGHSAAVLANGWWAVNRCPEWSSPPTEVVLPAHETAHNMFELPLLVALWPLLSID